MTNGIYKVTSIWPGHVSDGADHQFRTVVDFGSQKFFAIKVGEQGRGRSQRFIPLVNRPAPEKSDLRALNVHFIRLRQGRAGWIGEVVEDDAVPPVGSLVLLDTHGGYRGYTGLPSVVGTAQIIETGWYAQGMAGRAGSHPQVIILATGPARIEWVRSGRLYGGEPYWVAWTVDGLTWNCLPRRDYDQACDIGLVPDAVMCLQNQA